MSLHNWSNRKIIVEDTSSYMNNIDYDVVEEARGKKIADPIRAKLMGMEDIRDLKGTMTPRYFATKVIRFLQKENPELDLENLSDDDIQNAINVVANVSKPLAQRSDIKITTRQRGAAKEGLKKGDTGFETLQLNLGDDTTLKSQGEVGENDLYTVVSDGLKYRVTLNNFKGTKINLDDISQDDVVSVVIVKPSETETVDKFGGEIDLGTREKLVADFPEGEEHGEEDAEIDKDKADLDDDGELSEYEKARGQAIADAIEKQDKKDEEDAESCSEEGEPEDMESCSEEDEPEEDAERCPVTGKLRKKSDEETCDEEEQEIAMSPQAINRAMIERGRNELHRHHQIERMFRHGY